MNIRYRPSTLADYPALAELLRAAGSRYAVSAAELETMVRDIQEHPAQPHFFEVVAEAAGQLVGVLTIWQNGGRFDPDRYEVQIVVLPEAEGQGLGRKLALSAQEHLQKLKAREVVSGTYEQNGRALEFLTRQGFTEQFRYFDNVLDLHDWNAEAWPVPPLPEGLRLLTLKGLIAEQGEEAAWRAFYSAFAEARQDVPSQMPPSPQPFEVFYRRSKAPGYSPQSVFLAVTQAGEVVALSELKASPQDSTLMHIGLTGTRRAWRRRGLAQVLKLAALQWARQHGVRQVKTGNATSNLAILNLNQSLGFRPQRVWVEMSRRV